MPNTEQEYQQPQDIQMTELEALGPHPGNIAVPTEDIEDFLHGVNITKVVEDTERTQRTVLSMLQVLIVLNAHQLADVQSAV